MGRMERSLRDGKFFRRMTEKEARNVDIYLPDKKYGVC